MLVALYLTSNWRRSQWNTERIIKKLIWFCVEIPLLGYRVLERRIETINQENNKQDILFVYWHLNSKILLNFALMKRKIRLMPQCELPITRHLLNFANRHGCSYPCHPSCTQI